MQFSYNMYKPLWDSSNFMLTSRPLSFMQNGQFNAFQMPLFGAVSTSSTSGADTDSYESRREAELKKEEEREKAISFIKERAQEIKKTKDLVKAHDNAIKDIKKGKKSDGTYVVEAAVLNGPQIKEDGTVDKEASKPKKKGFFAKAGEWVCSAGAALKNMGKSLIGYDEKGKWSFKKLLRNAVITVGAVGATFIPVIGPAISYGLLAYGAVSGTVGVAKGISKLNNAKTEEEKEQARQDICSGAFVGATSVLGLRGLGKSVSTAAKAAGTNPTTMGVSAVAKTRTGIGKPVQVISQSVRDMTVNAFKATMEVMKSDKSHLARSGGVFKGFGKVYASKVKKAVKNVSDWTKKYQDKFNEMETSLNKQISELNNKIAVETNASKRTLLQEQKAMLENNLNELRTISGFKSKTEFDRLKTENSGVKNQEQLSSYTQNSRGGYEINGQSISQQRFNAFKKEMEAMQKSYIKNLKKLNNLKESQMRKFANKPDAHRRELNEYTDATVRAKYNTKAKLKAGIKNLSDKLSDLNTKIADIEAKLERATSPARKATLRRKLQNFNTQKLQVENELAICNSIKFKSLFKSSTWFKNEYKNYIGGTNLSFKLFANVSGKAIISPQAAAPIVISQWDRNYDLPLFGSLTKLTGEQADEYITALEQQKESYEKALESLNEIDTAEEWESLKAQYAAQLKAQEEAQAATQAQAAQQAGEAQAATQAQEEQPAGEAN